MSDNTHDLSSIWATMGSIVLAIMELALSTVPLMLLVFFLAWLSDKNCRFKFKAPGSKPVGEGSAVLIFIHCIIVLIWYFPAGSFRGEYPWWWVCMNSALFFVAVAVGVIAAGALVFGGFMILCFLWAAFCHATGLKWCPCSADKPPEYTAVAGEEVGLEDGLTEGESAKVDGVAKEEVGE